MQEDWVILTKFLPENWQTKAEELGALRRSKEAIEREKKRICKAVSIQLPLGYNSYLLFSNSFK